MDNFRDDVNQMDKLEIIDLECSEPIEIDEEQELTQEDIDELNGEPTWCTSCGFAVGASGCGCDDYED